MLSILNQLKTDNKLAAFYTNLEDHDTFLVGYIHAYNDYEIILHNIGTHGEFDGYTVMYIEDIYRIESSSQYLTKLTKLASLSKDSPNPLRILSNLFDSLLEAARARKDIATICISTNNNEVRGFIDEISGATIVVNMIDDYGRDNGKTVFFIDDILNITIENLNNKDIEKLKFSK